MDIKGENFGIIIIIIFKICIIGLNSVKEKFTASGPRGCVTRPTATIVIYVRTIKSTQ